MKTFCIITTATILGWVATTIVNGMATLSQKKPIHPASAILAK